MLHKHNRISPSMVRRRTANSSRRYHRLRRSMATQHITSFYKARGSSKSNLDNLYTSNTNSTKQLHSSRHLLLTRLPLANRIPVPSSHSKTNGSLPLQSKHTTSDSRAHLQSKTPSTRLNNRRCSQVTILTPLCLVSNIPRDRIREYKLQHRSGTPGQHRQASLTNLVHRAHQCHHYNTVTV
jgi:hypothetical protein